MHMSTHPLLKRWQMVLTSNGQMLVLCICTSVFLHLERIMSRTLRCQSLGLLFQ